MYFPYKSRYSRPFALVYFDVWGPSGISTHNGYQYFITFIDYFSHNTFVYLLTHHSQVANIIEKCVVMIENQPILLMSFLLNVKLFMKLPTVTLHNKMELLKEKIIFQELLKEKIIFWKLLVLSCFKGMFLNIFCGEAVLTSAFLINWMPSRILKGHTPVSILSLHRDHISFFIKSLAVYVLFIIILLILRNLTISPLELSSLVIALLKRV